MTALDGPRIISLLQQELSGKAEQLKKKYGRAPGLALILVGKNPASKAYIAAKKKLAEQIGLYPRLVSLPEDTGRSELIERILALNDAPEIDAISLQMPLPDHVDAAEMIEQIHPGKDADCLHPYNQGKLFLGRSLFFPCMPSGILHLLDTYKITIAGLNAAVIGRSSLVGKPLSVMLANRHATVTLCHTHTRNLGEIVRRSDLIIAAAGSPGLVTADMVREGAVLIDIGLNRIETEEEVRRLAAPDQMLKFTETGYVVVGDIHYHAYPSASYYTPVPGGVGPMSVVMLIRNAIHLFLQQIEFSR